MGPTNSKINKQHKIQHERFENAKIVANEELQILVRSTVDDYNSWKLNLKKISFANKQNILFPLNHSFQQEGWCSQNTGFVKITYDNYPFVFQQELENRISVDKHLSEQQMWYLLYTLVSTAKDFSLINKKVGDIRPHNIFVNQAGQIKLAVCFSWPNEATNLQKTINEKQITYLSPEQMQICKNNKIQTFMNSIVSESFSIGLTMLHAGLLFNLSSIYNLERCQINRKVLDEKVQSWMGLQFYDQNNTKMSYSSSLKQIVRNLCHYDHQTREKSTDIFNLLQPHKESILNIEAFELIYKEIPSNSQPNMNVKPMSNHLQKSEGFPIYNYAQISRNFPNTQTPISTNPNYDRSTRTFTQVLPNRPHNFQHQIFDRYANSANYKQKNDLNIRLTNTISQRQTIQSKPHYYIQPGLITVKPFMSIDQQIQHTNHHFKPLNVGPLERHVEKKVQSNDFIHFSSGMQQNQTQFNRIHVQNVPNQSSDFLRKIQQQIQKSKSMFPS